MPLTAATITRCVSSARHPRHQRVRLAFLVVGLGLTVAHLLAPAGVVRNVVYVMSLGQLLPALWLGQRHHRYPLSLAVTTAAMVICFVLTEVLAAAQSPDRNGAFSAVIETPRIAGQLLFTAALAVVVRQGHTSGWPALIGDATIVAVGAWTVSWMTLVQPAMQRSAMSPLATLVKGMSAPLGVVTVFLLVLLLLNDAGANAAVWFVGAAALSALAGDVGYALIAAGHVNSGTVGFDTLYVIALASGSAAFLDPGIGRLTRAEAIPRRRPATMRVALTFVAMVLLATLLAVVNGGSTLDRAMRLVTALAMAAAVTYRIVQALRADAAAQAKLLLNARHDPLTGLPNRQLVDEQLIAALEAARSTDRCPAVLFIDLDHFKKINDSLGHHVGDEALRVVTARLRDALPSTVTLGRLAGDEFIAIHPGTRAPGDAYEAAIRVLDAFNEPLVVDHFGIVPLSVSVGVALAERHDDGSLTSADELLRNADIAMYRAKASGRHCTTLFDRSMHDEVKARLTLESAMHGALDRREIHLEYQPIVDLGTGRVSGFEALMRWRPVDRDPVSPGAFIPIAEETGLIVPLGSWALLEALTQLRRWIDTGVCCPTTSMSVNVSARQLRDHGFVSVVREALIRSGVAADHLWLEVTESMLIIDTDLAATMLGQLRGLGVNLAIDDFGTGHSSLSLVNRFPLQRIKVDQSFVRRIAVDREHRSLVRTILAMAEALGLDAVAEGVETREQFETLRTLGCTRAQGFLFGRPVNADLVLRADDGRPFTEHATQPLDALWA